MSLRSLRLTVLFAAFSLMLAASAQAAAPRDAWVVQQVYNHNHPLASQLPSELRTKMARMASSPFSFYRGTAHVFYQDMKTLPGSSFTNHATSQTWINGDLHLRNIGAFKDASGTSMYDTNDFDEAYWGQYIWDVRRMAVSILLAAKENGISSARQQQLVLDFLTAYIGKIAEFRASNNDTGFRLTESNTSGAVNDAIQQSDAQTRARLLKKYTSAFNNRQLFKTSSDLQAVSATQYRSLLIAVASYVTSIPAAKRYAASYYMVKDIRLKLESGIGSLGRYRYFVLIEGVGNSDADDVILQMKQSLPSAVAIAAPGNLPAHVYENNEGQRTIKSMTANLGNADLLAGWTTLDELHFFVREKSPYEADFDTALLDDYGSFSAAMQYVGKVVAGNHARTDADHDATLIRYNIDQEIDALISTNPTAFKTEMLNFAIDYANQVQLDHQSFVSAYKKGVALY